MKRAYYILSLCAALSLSGRVNAQEKVTESVVDRVDTISVDYFSKYRAGFGDNWFIGATGAADILFAEDDGDLAFGQRIAPAWSFIVGKELFPSISLRATLGMNWFNGWNSGIGGVYKGKADWYATDPVRQYYESQGVDCSNGYEQHLQYLHAGADILFNLNRIFDHNIYKMRKADVYGLLGVDYLQLRALEGYYRTYKVGFKVGAAVNWNLTDRLAITAELSDVLADATFDNEIGKGMSLNSFATLSAGLIYRIGCQGYTIERLVTPAAYARMQDVLSTVREEYNQPVTKEDILLAGAAASEIGSLFAPSIVFDEGEATYSEELQMVNLYRIAKFMSQNPKLKLVVIGNTDACDSKLARRRAEIIRNTLIERYGLPPSRLKIALQNVNQEYNVTGHTQTVNFGAWM